MGTILLHRARWFIAQETDRTLQNVRNGTIGKEQATGSLSTLYQLAAVMEDKESMREISGTIASLRQTQLEFISRSLDLKSSTYGKQVTLGLI